MPSLGQLHKLKLESYSKPDFSADSKLGLFTVQVNPESYAITQSIEYNVQQPQGTSGAPLPFVRSGPQNMEFEFIFDGTGVIPKNGISRCKLQLFCLSSPEAVGLGLQSGRPG